MNLLFFLSFGSFRPAIIPARSDDDDNTWNFMVLKWNFMGMAQDAAWDCPPKQGIAVRIDGDHSILSVDI